MQPPYRPVQPSPRLSRFVDRVRVVRPVADRTLQIARFPDGRASMLLRVFADGSGDLSVAGTRSRALFKPMPPCASAILVDFKPGVALPIFGVPLGELTDRIRMLEELWGAAGAALCDRLLCAQTEADKLRVLEQALCDRLARAAEPSSSRLVRRAVRLIAQAGAPPPIEAVARELGVTGRHLRRAFHEALGVGPKQFARMLRLQHVLRAIGSARGWSELAANAGYYDQAHLIAEFRSLVGVTPRALLERARPAGSPERLLDVLWSQHPPQGPAGAVACGQQHRVTAAR